jgi:type II secretory pathway pseudopilin PulG
MFVPHGADDERATEADGAQRPAEEALAEELRAEFADHVASARERLEQQGVAAGDAQRRALDQFGDVAAVVRRCWWIRKGEEMMNRAISITLLVVLIAGLASLGVAGWQVQRAVGGRMDRLSEQLASLAETQQSLLAQQAQTLPVRIRGRLYLGDPSKPAAKAKLWIYRFTPGSEMNRLRRVETDAQGNFNSGPLPPGAYFVAAPLCDREANASDAGDGIQSRPLYLYEGN